VTSAEERVRRERHNTDFVEFVSAPGCSAHADLNHVTHEWSFDQFTGA